MAKKTYPIDYKEVISLGGAQQHIRIRGSDPSNPVLLFLHGGPGISDRHWVLKYQSALADVCTMVCWDQRGSAKSYNKKQSKLTMNIDLIVNDAAELAEYLCKKFNKEKIYVVGHSWGSILGILLVQKRGDLVAAYVGMGQVINVDENETLAYKFVWDEALRLGDKKAITELTRIGKPVEGSYGSLENLIVQRNYMTKYGGGSYKEKESIWKSVILPVLKSPEYTFADLFRYAKGSFYCLRQLWPEVAKTVRFDKTVKKLDVPVYITQGRHDQNTPSCIALEWFKTLDAPHKEWIWFEESAHSPIKEEHELWGKAIREKVFS